MVRKKTYSNSNYAGRGLILALWLFSATSFANTHKLGRITQASGEITFLDFTPPAHKLSTVKEEAQIRTNGSYLTQDASYFTVLLFEGSWLRVSPRSKISIEFDPKTKELTVHLLTGSIKALFSTLWNDKKLEKIIIKSSGAVFESVDGKFTVSRNSVSDSSSVYVEKGTVVAIQNIRNEKKDVELIHGKETVSIGDLDTVIPDPRQMTDKEIKFLHPSHYLKEAKKIN